MGSAVKEEDSTNSMIWAGLGSVLGSKTDKFIVSGLSTIQDIISGSYKDINMICCVFSQVSRYAPYVMIIGNQGRACVNLCSRRRPGQSLAGSNRGHFC